MPHHTYIRRVASRWAAPLLFTVWSVALLGCASGGTHRGLAPPGERIPVATGLPKDEALPRTEVEGKATWYGDRHHGRLTANGETFDMHAFTAAHRTLPFNTIVRVLDHETRRSVVVRINDRGPRRESLVIDLSKAAAAELDMVTRGKANVSLDVLSWGDGARYRNGRKIVPRSSPARQARATP